MFLPTLIHVSIFTGAFILIGALRGRSLSGLLSLLVFLAVPFVFLYALPGREHYAVSSYVRRPTGTCRTTARSPTASWGSTISS